MSTLSARAPIGAANRAALFGRSDEQAYSQASARSSTSAQSSRHDTGSAYADLSSLSYASDDSASAAAGLEPAAGSDLLELEHIIGYTGHHLRTVAAHPREPGAVLKAVSSVLVVGHVSDPHRQEPLRGHDCEITVLAVSPCGSYLATGQSGSTKVKGFPSPVILWDYASRRAALRLGGISQGVSLLAFSPDSRLLMGAGADGVLYIWDVASGEVCYGKRHAAPPQLFQWGAVHSDGRRPVYTAHLCCGTDLSALTLSFDAARRQWALAAAPMIAPSSGVKKVYHCSAVMPAPLPAGGWLLCGSEAGDLIVFSVVPRVYRASVPVCAGGLLALCVDPSDPGVLFCGGGDGTVR
jgi:WD40 repeat protein